MSKSLDWYTLQKKTQGWDALSADQNLVNLVKHKKWSLDLTKCHDSLAQSLMPYHVDKLHTDFFVITDIELSKLPLSLLFKMFRHQYNNSRVGGYIAVLSYYINADTPYHNLSDTYTNNVKTVFKQNLSFATKLENWSVMVEEPITKIKNNMLIEGSNFIFVHPNIRYVLWK